MTTEFAAALKQRIEAYRTFAADASITSCRLVHYCGVNRPNAMNVPLDQIEDQIAGCICEGFLVNWMYRDHRLYLCVQEPDGPIPEWSKVVAEEAIEDVDEILRSAGFDPDSA